MFMNRLQLTLMVSITALLPVFTQAQELNATGEKLEASYEAQAKQLKADIEKALSFVDASKKTAYLQARETEAEARKQFETYNKGIKGGVKKAEGLVSHAKNKWIRGAENGLTKAKQQHKAAKNDGQRKKAESEIAKWEKNLKDGQEALKERQKALDLAIKAESEGPRLIKEATEALAKAQANTEQVLAQTGLSEVLMKGALDGKLAKYVVIKEGTPKGLALFAQQSPQHEKLINDLLSNETLMLRMLVADDAERPKSGPAQYGPAMQIYTDIMSTSPKAKSGVLYELALATALEHSVPNKQRNAAADTEAPDYVDPVKRYKTYEKAFLDGELDPAFEGFNAWELRHVVNGDEPDEIIGWGRTLMRNFRPEQTRGDYGWRYVRIVPTDVKYGSGRVPLDRPELQFFQNIIMNGGICGRRAFFGRFVLRSFGIPTIARPSRGHAALAHWTPKGWVVNLGPGWGGGWTKTKYKNGRDFVATSSARNSRMEYPAVKRAMWIGDVFGESRVYGENQDKADPGFWNAMSLHLQRRIITKSKSETLEALGTNLGEADASSEVIDEGAGEPEKEKISYGQDGTIHIPAAAFTSTKGSHPVRSYDEGMQIFMPRFDPKGLTIVRGGTWKTDAAGSDYANRGISAGYGRYNNWGMRAALYPPADKSNLPAELKVDLGDGVSMEFVYIQPGSFMMGGDNAKDSKWGGANAPKHKVTISKGFYLGKYEVTQEQYVAVMGNNPSDKKHRDPNLPVDTVSDTDANRFCNNMSKKTGFDINVPTEAQWEYAARAGKDTPWPFADKPGLLAEYAWFKDNSDGKPHPVVTKKPNPWGLHGMYGNVCERVRDRYDRNFYKNSPEVDPVSLGISKTSVTNYEIKSPSSGSYELSANVVTVNYDQHLMVSINGGEPVEIILPYTSGERQYSEPVTIELKRGSNKLEFYRIDAPQYGIAVKSFKLAPAN